MARLRIAAVGRLRAFDDTFEVQDPLGLGITFVLLRRDAQEHVEWLEKRATTDPLAIALQEKEFEGLVALNDAKDDEEATAAALGKLVNKGAQLLDIIRSGRVNAGEVMRLKARGDLDEATSLVKSWSGDGIKDIETGKPSECTPANVRDLLTSDAEVTEGASEGKTLGEVLVPWIIEQSQQRTRLARRVAEEAVKASAPPSGS